MTLDDKVDESNHLPGGFQVLQDNSEQSIEYALLDFGYLPVNLGRTSSCPAKQHLENGEGQRVAKLEDRSPFKRTQPQSDQAGG